MMLPVNFADILHQEELPFHSQFIECFYHERAFDFVKCFFCVYDINYLGFVLYS